MKKPAFPSKKSSSKFNGPTGRTSSRAPSSRVPSSKSYGEFSDTKKGFRTNDSKTAFGSKENKPSRALVSAPRAPYKERTATPFKSSPRTDDKKSSYPTRTPFVRTSSHSESKGPQPTTYKLKPTPDTSWGKVADWYNKHLETGDDTYHSKIIFPGVTRMLGDVSGKKVLDMACGQGIFSEKLRDSGALVTGVDLGKQLIKIAEEKSLSVKEKGTHKVTYHTASSDDMYMLKDNSFDVVVCILALQNIENLQKTINEASRVLTPAGTFLFVLNHPSFRNPRKTMWGFNEADDTQYRRVDEYMSESNIKVDMTPGSLKDKKFTVSFHRPLQVYMKALSKSGFAITRLEEWISHKESERGPKKRAEDTSRKEIPMFMCIEAQKNSH